MPSSSIKQQRAMGMAYALRKGKIDPDKVSESIKNMAKSMTEKQLKDFASTSHDDIKKQNHKKTAGILSKVLKYGIKGLFSKPSLATLAITSPYIYNKIHDKNSTGIFKDIRYYMDKSLSPLSNNAMDFLSTKDLIERYARNESQFKYIIDELNKNKVSLSPAEYNYSLNYAKQMYDSVNNEQLADVIRNRLMQSKDENLPNRLDLLKKFYISSFDKTTNSMKNNSNNVDVLSKNNL